MVINFKKNIFVFSILLLSKFYAFSVPIEDLQLELDKHLAVAFISLHVFNVDQDWLNEVEHLLEKGANPNWIINLVHDREEQLETCLFDAIRQCALEENSQLKKTFCRRGIKLLLKHGASVDFRNRNGLTPLALADQLGIPEVLRQN